MEEKSKDKAGLKKDASASESAPVQQDEPAFEQDQANEEKPFEINEYRKKGMERLSGDNKVVQTSMMIMTKEGWKPVMVKRKKISY